MRGHELDDLGHVDGAAAPESDEGIAAAVPECGRPLFDVFLDGIG